MANHKARPKHWADIEQWAEQTDSASDHCFLELKDRVENLEFAVRQVRADHLRLANACAKLAPDRNAFLASLIPDSDDNDNLVSPFLP